MGAKSAALSASLWASLKERGRQQRRRPLSQSTVQACCIWLSLIMLLCLLVSPIGQCSFKGISRRAGAELTSSPKARQTRKATLGGNHRASSSSSPLSDIEDLTDSSIRTKIGTLAGPASLASFSPSSSSSSSSLPTSSSANHPPPSDFPRLLERLEAQARSKTVKSMAALADANNKTSMRFFQNSKTFASIVYTNEPHSSRRLINCHLVDLEKHAPDVALFEARYDIGTLSVDFRDMMQLIECCTNIARFRPLRPVAHQHHAHQQAHHAHNGSALGKAAAALPALLLERPGALVSQAPGTSSVATFASVMSGALDQQLKQLPPTVDDSSKLDLPPTPTRRTKRRLSALQLAAQHPPPLAPPAPLNQNSGQNEQLWQHQHSHASHSLKQALAKAPENSKHLVLGEVTPPPSAVDGHSGGLREALQEITSYDTTDLMAIWRGILPGTNWCGMGDRASSYNDLGFESDIDICCRAHDFCPVRLSAFSSGYGLFNWSFYTRSHCTCDQNFLDCLQRAESPLSSVVMKFYFNIMKTTCLHDNETQINSFTSQASQQQQQQQIQTQPLQQNKQPGKNGAPMSLVSLTRLLTLGAQATGRRAGVNSGPQIPALKAAKSKVLNSRLESRRQP